VIPAACPHLREQHRPRRTPRRRHRRQPDKRSRTYSVVADRSGNDRRRTSVRQLSAPRGRRDEAQGGGGVAARQARRGRPRGRPRAPSSPVRQRCELFRLELPEKLGRQPHSILLFHASPCESCQRVSDSIALQASSGRTVQRRRAMNGSSRGSADDDDWAADVNRPACCPRAAARRGLGPRGATTAARRRTRRRGAARARRAGS
jgi:hypothetical protein